MKLSEKAAYLKGLAEGLSLDKTTPEGKLLTAMLDLLGDVTDAIGEIDEDLEYLNDYVEELDEDLGEVEKAIYGDDCDCDCDCCDGECEDWDEDCDFNCDECDHPCFDEEDEQQDADAEEDAD
ncbi:MAG: hypothetical protein PUA74_05535 [Clostridiales bacterium]|nr:hypothetical protein [Clostridiales bacterium]